MELDNPNIYKDCQTARTFKSLTKSHYGHKWIYNAASSGLYRFILEFILDLNKFNCGRGEFFFYKLIRP